MSAKPGVPQIPGVPLDWVLTIDVDGVAETYVEFWQPKFLGKRQGPELDAVGLDALSAGYFLEAEQTEPPPDEFAHLYSATLSNENLPRACESMLQLGIRARIHVAVRPRSEVLCSMVIGTSREASHVLGQFFPDLKPIGSRAFQAAAKGKLIRPLQLTALTIPRLPGMDEATPLPVEVPVRRAPPEERIGIGHFLSPYNRRPVGPACLTPAELLRSTLVMGTIGSGKTNLMLNLILGARRHASVLAFDVKREYRTLHKLVGAKVYGFRAGMPILTHNLMKPEGSPSEWVKRFAEIFGECISRLVPASGSKDMIAEIMDEMFRSRGIYDNPPSTNYPHIGDLLEALDARSQNTRADRERNWYASAMRVLRTLNIGATRTAFCVREGLAIERLLDGVVVVELDGIGDSAASALLVSVLLEKIRARRLSAPQSEELKHLVVVEEAQNLLARGQEATSFIADACRELRGLGVGLCYVTQLPSHFSTNALANVNTIFGLKLVLPEDKRMAANILGLEGDAAKLIGRLPVGQALMRTEQLGLVGVPLVPRPVVHDSELPAVAVTPQEVSSNPAQRREVENRTLHLKPRALQVFFMVAEGREVHPTGLKTGLGYSHSDVTQCLRVLIHKGLLNYARAKKSGKGKARTIYFPSPAGMEAYRQHKGRYPDRKTTQSPNHAAMVKAVLEKTGIKRKPHARFDVLYDEGEAEKAIEVESGANNDEQLATNLTKSLDLQNEARFVAADDQTYNRILQNCARLCFGERKPITVKIALLESLSAWDTFTFQPVPTTP